MRFERKLRILVGSCLVAASLPALVVLMRAVQAGRFLRPSLPAAAVAKVTGPVARAPGEIAGVFEKNQTFTEALASHGVSSREIQQLVEHTRSVYNLARVSANREYRLALGPDGSFQRFGYQVDEDRYLTVSRAEGAYAPALESIPYERRAEVVTGVIDGSLLDAVARTGEQERLGLELAAIFTYDIDFYTDLQEGDTFRLLVEKKYLDGKFRYYGPILAAEITNRGRTFSGFRYASREGKPEYYAADGRALKKSFLKSPLKFGRITSKFSHARYHPILKVVRPHLGVDYAAPVGTPVVAVASGTVVQAGAGGGGGKTVRLRHAQGLETIYMHLSHIAVRSGARVGQGQIVGSVGATGLATGPHLDFRVRERGRYLNPARMIVPPAAPVPQAEMARFAEGCEKLRARLHQAGTDILVVGETPGVPTRPVRLP